MDTLPRWASVAITARCAELIAPAFERLVPDFPHGFTDTLADAIEATRDSSEMGRLNEEVVRLEGETTQLFGRFQLLLQARETGDEEMESLAEMPFAKGIEDRVLKVAGTILDVAARGLRVAMNESRDAAFSECGDALGWARAVMDHLDAGPGIEQRLDHDIDTLWDQCEAKGTGDSDWIRFDNGVWLLQDQLS